MKLASAQPDQVVRNANNGSHYRFERLERGRVRIIPLELFPNGLLITKPTPTTVDGDIEVVLVGMWTEDMAVEGKPDNSRRVYENELVRLQLEIVDLQEAYDALPRSGTGRVSRGSWANKLKAVRRRIEVLQRGLGFIDADLKIHAATEEAHVDWQKDQLVQVPSGRIGKVVGFQPMGDGTYVVIRTLFRGATLEAALPCEVLRPAEQARLCTV